MIRFFRSPQPAALFIIPFITMLLWSIGWVFMPVYNASGLSPVWNFIQPLFFVMPVAIRTLLMVLVVSTSAIYFNRLMNRHEVLYKNSYLPSLFYVLLSSAFPAFLSVHPIHFINLMLLLLLDSSFDFFKNDRVVKSIFNGGFLTGVICIIYFPMFPLILFYFMVLVILRSFELREWLIAAVGIFVPFFFLAVWWFPQTLIGQVHWLNDYILNYRLAVLMPLPAKANVLALFIGLLVLVSIVKLRSHYYKNIVRTRAYQQSIILLLLFLIGIIFLSGNMMVANFSTLVIPCAVVITYWFVAAKKRLWFYELTLWAFIGLIVWNHLSS